MFVVFSGECLWCALICNCDGIRCIVLESCLKRQQQLGGLPPMPLPSILQKVLVLEFGEEMPPFSTSAYEDMVSSNEVRWQAHGLIRKQPVKKRRSTTAKPTTEIMFMVEKSRTLADALLSALKTNRRKIPSKVGTVHELGECTVV